MIGSSRTISVAAASVFAAALFSYPGPVTAEGTVATLRAAVIGAAGPAPVLTIELFRWSTEAERAPLLAALAPAPTPPSAQTEAGGRAGAGGRAAGRGGRGGRGAAPPASPAVRLTGAVKAAPTVGFVWGDGPTGYSIKYAWRSTSPDGGERLVLVTDRRLGAHSPAWPQPPAMDPDAEFTVIEMRVDGKGAGEGKTSLASAVVVDAEARTLALQGYAAAPALLEVTR